VRELVHHRDTAGGDAEHAPAGRGTVTRYTGGSARRHTAGRAGPRSAG